MVSSLYAEAQHLIILYSLVLWSDQPSSGTSSQTGFHVSRNSFVLCSTPLPATYKQLYCETHRTSLSTGTKRGKLPSLQSKHLASWTKVPTVLDAAEKRGTKIITYTTWKNNQRGRVRMGPFLTTITSSLLWSRIIDCSLGSVWPQQTANSKNTADGHRRAAVEGLQSELQPFSAWHGSVHL